MTNGALIKRVPAATSIVRPQKKNGLSTRAVMTENFRAVAIDIAKIETTRPDGQHRSGRCLRLQ